MSTTRLSQAGIGSAVYGTFQPKSAGPHNPGVITRLTVSGIMGAKYGTFLPKADGGGAVGDSSEWLIRARRRGRR